MKKLFVLFYALMCLVTLQAQKVTLQDVANGTYRPIAHKVYRD